MAWTAAQEQELVRLASEQRYFFTEIAEKIGKPVQLVRWKARQLGIPSTRKTLKGRMGKWNSKHAHLREQVMRYFLTHSAEETQEKFKLTPSEFKSLLTVSYKDPRLTHLRKDTRRRDAWSARELKFMLQHAGLKPRDWIGKKLKRGGPLCIKDRLEVLGVASKSVNGITLSQFREAFGRDPAFFFLTKAGPGRGGTPTYYRIIPWVWLDQELRARRLRTAKPFRQLVSAMALFQNWIHDGDAIGNIERILGKRSRHD